MRGFRNHRRCAKEHCRLGSQVTVAIFKASCPNVGICRKTKGQMVHANDLADQAVDSANIDSSASRAGSRVKYVTSCVSMSENQNTPVADRLGNLVSVFRALVRLSAAGWCFDDYQSCRESAGQP